MADENLLKRMAPNSREAEQSVIGAMLMDKEAIEVASEIINPEDFYKDEDVVITISHLGYIKRTPLTEFRTQNRGGVGMKGVATRDSDFIEHIYVANMHSTMLFFTAKGMCYRIKVYELPEGNRSSKGRVIRNLRPIEADDSIITYLNAKSIEDKEYTDSHYVVMVTREGVIKKTLLTEYANSRTRNKGITAIIAATCKNTYTFFGSTF